MPKLNNDEEKSMEILGAEAIDVAIKAFQEYISKFGYDPAYFDIRFTAWVKSSDFCHRLARVEIERELNEGKD